MPVQTQIQARRGTAATWTSTNPTLAAGETGYETDTGKFKIGTGSTAWASLGYFNQDPVTTKGDLFTFSTTDARLAVGNNGEQLVADSAATTGLRYQEPLNLNPVLNSGYDVWQRGTASTAIGSGTFLADRWQAARTGFAAGASQSQQVTGDTTNLPNIQYCLRVQRDSGNTSTLAVIMGQNIESVNSIPYAGKTVTLSFYARAGANFSAASSILSSYFASGTGTDQNLVTSGTLTGINNTTTNHTLTTTWQRFTVTKAIDSTATQLAFQFFYTPVGTAGAADYFEVTGVMINVGSVAYPFRRTTGTIQGEIAACQRYFQRFDSAANADLDFGNGTFLNTNLFRTVIPLQVTMRSAPTAVLSAVSTLQITSSTNITPISSTLNSAGNKSICLGFSTATGTAGYAGILRAAATTSAYFELSAEL